MGKITTWIIIQKKQVFNSSKMNPSRSEINEISLPLELSMV
jgi:hypothetical protein